MGKRCYGLDFVILPRLPSSAHLDNKPGHSHYQNCQTDNLPLLQSHKKWLVYPEKPQTKITGSIEAEVQEEQGALWLEPPA